MSLKCHPYFICIVACQSKSFPTNEALHVAAGSKLICTFQDQCVLTWKSDLGVRPLLEQQLLLAVEDEHAEGSV